MASSLRDTAGPPAQAGVVAPRPRDEPGPPRSEEPRCCRRRKEEEEEDEEVDPRVQVELEKLNQSTDAINRLETELEEARSRFRVVLAEATARLDEFLKKLGKAVEESKPYWEARRAARQAQVSAQRATQDFQRASEVLRAAKETIALAEERLLEQEDRHFDSAWQEMLNHATLKVMKAEQDKGRSEMVHKQTAERYSVTMMHMNQLERKLKRTIKKSRPYYEMKAKYYLELEHQKQRVEALQEAVATTKGQYRAALNSLERISDEIHARRKAGAGLESRGHGVGAETTAAFSMELGFFSADGDTYSVASDACESDACSLLASEDDSCSESCSPCSGGMPPLPTCPPVLQLTPSQPGSGASSCSGFGSNTGSGCGFGSSTGFGFGSSTSSGSGFGSSTVSESSADPDSGFFSPVHDERLGPRSDCSGASSPECEGVRPLAGAGSSLGPCESSEEAEAEHQSREGPGDERATSAEERERRDAAASGAGGESVPREEEGAAAQSAMGGENGAGGGGTLVKKGGDRRGVENREGEVASGDGCGAAACESSPEEEPALAARLAGGEEGRDPNVCGVTLEPNDEEEEDEEEGDLPSDGGDSGAADEAGGLAEGARGASATLTGL